MTWFMNAFSVVSRGAGAGLRFASAIVKPVLSAIIAVAPGIASAARTLSVIPIIGQAAVTVAQAAVLVETLAKTGKDIIGLQKTSMQAPPAQVPIFTRTESIQDAPIAVQV